MQDVETLGEDIYRRAKLDPREPPDGGSVDIALGVLGRGCIELVRTSTVYGDVGTVAGKPRIMVARGLHPRRSNYVVALMVARLELRALGCWTELDERRLAGWLCAPTPSFRSRLHRSGLDLEELATTFAVTETCVAMRVVEVGANDGVVVTPDRVYRPGPGLAWVSDESARKLARSSPRTLRKVPIHDEPGRVALYRRAG